MGDGLEVEGWAALLRRAGEVSQIVERLADRLEAALPGRVSVERSGRLHGRRLRSLAVELGDDRLRMEVDGLRCRALLDHIVRGVCLRSDELTADEWIDRLAALLAEEAERSTQVRLALEAAFQ